MARPCRFWERVVQSGDCWIYTGALDHGGYGHINIGGHKMAHRYAYTLMRADIPEGLTLDHVCRTPACVNPDHLDPVPLSINVARANAGPRVTGQTHCLRGHEFTTENTHIYAGRRHCRACQRIRNAMRNAVRSN